MTRQQFHQSLEATFKRCLSTARKKNADYSGAAESSDPFANFRAVELLGLTSTERGILVRITDKLKRVSNLLEQEAQVKDESITDTIDDAITYFAILKAFIESRTLPCADAPSSSSVSGHGD